MKPFITTLCTVLLTLIAVTGFAQSAVSNRQPIFTRFPQTIDCSEAELNKVFDNAQGTTTTVSFGAKFSISGTVITNMVKYSKLQTVAIKVPSLNNTVFALSKRMDENNQVVYSGRMINPKNSDGFELKRTAAGIYQLVKIETAKILPDCAQQ